MKLRLPVDIARVLKILAFDERRSMQDVVSEAIELYLARRNKVQQEKADKQTAQNAINQSFKERERV